MSPRRVLVVCVLTGLCLVTPGLGAEKKPSAKPAKPDPTQTGVTVAVLSYEGAVPGQTNLGTQIADILTARLSVEDAFTLVERAKLGKILAEHQLNLTGMVDQDQAVKAGRLVGAKLLVMGKVFPIGKQLMMVTKVVGVETGKLKGTLRQVPLDKPMAEAIMLLAEDVAGVIKRSGRSLLPPDEKLTDPVADLRKALAAKVRPTVAVLVPESHLTRVVVDPAVETELKKMLTSCAVTVVDTGKNDLADWARKMLKSAKQPWPAGVDKADYVIVGEAFSEFAGRTGDLVSCAARAEINVIERKTGKIVRADRHTARAVDLAEALAGKTALQKCGRKLGLRLLEHFAQVLPTEKKGKAGGK